MAPERINIRRTDHMTVPFSTVRAQAFEAAGNTLGSVKTLKLVRVRTSWLGNTIVRDFVIEKKRHDR